MECPECGAELCHYDDYGYFAPHQSGEKIGQIFKCPNFEGFEDAEELKRYRAKHPELDTVKDEDIICESAINNGRYFTRKNGDLVEGFPC